MAMNTYLGTGGGYTTQAQRLVYDMTLIKRLLPMLPYFEDGVKGTVGKNMGGFQADSIQFRQYKLTSGTALATSAITEGSPPTEDDLAITTVTTALAQYGSWSRHSDVFRDAGIDPVVQELVGLHGEQAGQSLSSIIGTELSRTTSSGGNTGATIRYANGRVSRVTVAAGDNLLAVEVRKTVRDLTVANVPRYPDGYYRAIITPKQAYDLQAETAAGGWQDAIKYTDSMPLLSGEVGRFAGVRFRVSTQAPIFAGAGAAGIDVHGGLFYGPGAWGVRDFATQTVPTIDAMTNRGVSTHVIPVEEDDKADPLNQYGTVGWKVAFAVKVLDPARIVRVETAVSA